MTKIENANAREFIQALSPRNAEFVANQCAADLQMTRRARLKDSSAIEFVQGEREFVDRVLAAELFPDYPEPFLEIAKDEADGHDVLRKKHPLSTSTKRISAELYTMQNLPELCRFRAWSYHFTA